MSSHDGPLAGWQEFWRNNGDAVETLGMYAGGILAYALVVNYFYQVLSRRVMFGGRQTAQGERVGGPLAGFAYLILFPLFSFGFFLLLSLALTFLGGERQVPQLTLTLAMAVVLAVRVAAYVSQRTAVDVAKVLPLGLLGVILVNAQVATLRDSLHNLRGLVDHVDLVVLYFGIVVVAEYALRSVYLLVQAMRGRQPPDRPQRPPRPTGAHGAEPRGGRHDDAAGRQAP